MTHAATTRTLMQPTALSLLLVKAQSDAIREISTLAGIVLLVLLVTQRCPLNVQVCVVVVRMPQDGSEDSILLWQTVKWLVKFVIIGQTTAVGGKTTLKSKTVECFMCMSCKKRLCARFDTVVSVAFLCRDNVTQFGNRHWIEGNDCGKERREVPACISHINWNNYSDGNFPARLWGLTNSTWRFQSGP